MNRKLQGDLGVAKAIAYYVEQGYNVSVPLTDATRYDLIVERDSVLMRVQVKSTNQFSTHRTPVVTLSTQGGNQSWGGVIKRITADEVDRVFVYCLNGSAWDFPVEVCADKRSLVLGKLQDCYKVC